MSFLDLLSPDNVLVGIPAADRDSMFETLVDALPVADAAVRGEALTSVMEREELGTTGIGQSIAIPHGRASIQQPLSSADFRARHLLARDAQEVIDLFREETPR